MEQSQISEKNMETRKSSPDKKEIRKKHLAIRDAMSESENMKEQKNL